MSLAGIGHRAYPVRRITERAGRRRRTVSRPDRSRQPESIVTKIYLAGPLFTIAEQDFNAGLARFLEAEGFDVWLPQEHEPRSKSAPRNLSHGRESDRPG